MQAEKQLVMDRSDGPPPQQILVIRHAEKPPLFGPPHGIKEDGRLDHHSLVVRGWQRAGALVEYFATPRDAAIRRPTCVYAPPNLGTEGDHGRPYQTVSPVAARLYCEIDARFGLESEHDLVADVLTRSGVVLISWEHKRIPHIADAILGDEKAAPQTWPDDRFDLVWVFDRRPDGCYAFSQRPQLLLAGDRPEVAPTG